MFDNKLKVNERKTEFIIFVSRRGQALVDSHMPVLRIGDADVKPSLRVKDLGVTLDLHLTMVPAGVLRVFSSAQYQQSAEEP